MSCNEPIPWFHNKSIPRRDSNTEPPLYESGALPTELQGNKETRLVEPRGSHPIKGEDISLEEDDEASLHKLKNTPYLIVQYIQFRSDVILHKRLDHFQKYL
jgi:hypothetical protein